MTELPGFAVCLVGVARWHNNDEHPELSGWRNEPCGKPTVKGLGDTGHCANHATPRERAKYLQRFTNG